MSLSRWKLMAGVLGVSIGGLAAAASQCPKFDKSKGRSPETPVAKADSKVPPAGAPAAPTPPAVPPASLDLPTLPTPPSTGPAIPAPPSLAPAGATPPLPSPSTEVPKPAAPSTPPAPMVEQPKPPAPGVGGLPPLPADVGPALPESKPAKAPEAASPALPPLPGTPSTTAPAKPADPKPSDPGKPAVTPPVADLIPPMPGKPTPPPTSGGPDGRGLVGTPQFTGPGGEVLPLNPGPAGSSQEKMIPKPAVVGIGAAQPVGPGAPVASPPAPPSGSPSTPPALPMNDLPPAPPLIPDGGTTSMETKRALPAGAKFRILLRVGEGEPTFEVKNGDNLVLKVACEKVDIKSPEKGGGLSEVTARGKVRFAGFGAEGTCDELKFLAGTGEVSMTGEVKVQVKDKLGRIESELTTGSMKYKIDASAIGGAIKP